MNFADVKTAVSQLTQSQPQIISLQPNTLKEVWADIQRVGLSLGVESESLPDSITTSRQSLPGKTKTYQITIAPQLLRLSGQNL